MITGGRKHHLYESLRIALIMAVLIGGIYAVWITARVFLADDWGMPSPLIVFGLNFTYCSVPLFALLWPIIGLMRRVEKD